MLPMLTDNSAIQQSQVNLFDSKRRIKFLQDELSKLLETGKNESLNSLDDFKECLTEINEIPITKKPEEIKTKSIFNLFKPKQDPQKSVLAEMNFKKQKSTKNPLDLLRFGAECYVSS